MRSGMAIAAAVPLAEAVEMTGNTGKVSVGEGLLWRARVEPTGFRITIADPVQGRRPTESLARPAAKLTGWTLVTRS